MENFKLTDKQMAAQVNYRKDQFVEALEFCVRMLDARAMEISRQVSGALRSSDTETAKDLATYQVQITGYRITLQDQATLLKNISIEGAAK